MCNDSTRVTIDLMTQKSEIGKLGENLACEYLKSKGYFILERNFRKPWGELDIIAREGDGTLVFVEVKALRQTMAIPPRQSSGNNIYENWQELTPEEHLTYAKLKKLRRTASLYAGHRQELVKDKKGWRIDLVAISLPIYLTKSLKNCIINHYENV